MQRSALGQAELTTHHHVLRRLEATRTYHLYQLPLLTRKLRVVADWTTSLFFRRDIAELGTLGNPERLES